MPFLVPSAERRYPGRALAKSGCMPLSETIHTADACLITVRLPHANISASVSKRRSAELRLLHSCVPSVEQHTEFPGVGLPRWRLHNHQESAPPRLVIMRWHSILPPDVSKQSDFGVGVAMGRRRGDYQAMLGGLVARGDEAQLVEVAYITVRRREVRVCGLSSRERGACVVAADTAAILKHGCEMYGRGRSLDRRR